MDSFLAYPLEPQKLRRDSDMCTLARLRRTMSQEDQAILDALLASVQHHWPLQETFAHLTPLNLLLITILIEQEKEMRRLSSMVRGSNEAPDTGE